MVRMKFTNGFWCFILLLFLSNCSAWKSDLKRVGNQNVAVENAVTDFFATSRLSKKDSIFSILIEHIDDNILGVSLLGYYGKIRLKPEDKIGAKTRLPTRFIEKEGKLFYWDDSTQVLTREIVDVFTEYQILDTLRGDFDLDLFRFDPTNHYKKGVHYYVCKNDLSIYKRVTSSIAMGWYDAPGLNCFKK